MSSSTLIVDYVGRGTHAARPATPNIPTGATALYYETDTTIAFVWDGSAWHALNAATPGSVTSVALSVPASSLFGVSGSPVTTTGTLGVTTTGTSGGIPYFFDANTLKTSGALTANLPVIGGGAGVAPTVGTRSGNTTSFATTSGALTSGNVAVFDASGNIVDGNKPRYDIAFSAPQTTAYTASQVIGHHRFSTAVTIPANFGAYLTRTSKAGGSAVTTASTVFNVDKAASATPNTFSNIGTITFAIGTVTPTFASSGGTSISIAAGDVLRIVAPASPDATFAGFYATLVGSET